MQFSFQDDLCDIDCLPDLETNTANNLLGFQDNRCSLSRVENKIELIGTMHFWDPNGNAQRF